MFIYVDCRVAEFFLSSDDPNLIVDLWSQNKRSENPDYEIFWQNNEVVDETTVVHERRSNEIGYLPEWISVRDLREFILSKCPPSTPAPSESWIRLMFHSTNKFISTAGNRYNIKYKV